MSTKRPGHERLASADAGRVLFGQTRGRVLAWMLGHPDESFYLREIVRRSGAAHGAVQRELELLTRIGLLLRTMRGRQVYFQADQRSPLFPELQRLVFKTTAVAEVLREALVPLGDAIVIALVFGSAARGELRPESDLDLLVVGDVTFSQVAQVVAPAQERLGRDVNPSVYRPSEFRAKLQARHHFLTTVLAEPTIFVIGQQHVLDGLAAERVADAASIQPGGDSKPAGRRGAGSRGQRH